MKTKIWTCAYDGTIKKLDDGRCAACGRATEEEAMRDAKDWDITYLIANALEHIDTDKKKAKRYLKAALLKAEGLA